MLCAQYTNSGPPVPLLPCCLPHVNKVKNTRYARLVLHYSVDCRSLKGLGDRRYVERKEDRRSAWPLQSGEQTLLSWS